MALVARYQFTKRRHGDFGVLADGVERRRRGLVDIPCTWLSQVHGSSVVTVTKPGQHVGAPADAAVTATSGLSLAIQTADCAPIALIAPGALGVVHAGWRGLQSGVVRNAVLAIERLTDGPIRAVVGPCIHPECYGFGAAELDELAELFGEEVRSTTSDGEPALDLPSGVKSALRMSGVESIDDMNCCTACSQEHWSHRARGDAQRQVLVAWLEESSVTFSGS